MHQPALIPLSELPEITSSLIEAPTPHGMNPAEPSSAIGDLRVALMEAGCFVLRVEGAGAAVRSATEQWRRFYALPDSVKQTCKTESEERGGWLRLRDHPVYASHMSSSEQLATRCKEQFGCQAHSQNDCWPGDEICPGFRSDISACAERLNDVADRLLARFGELLGQEASFLLREPGYLTFTSYPATRPAATAQDEGVGLSGIGLGEHSDASVFTMLRQTVPGLQIKLHGEWRTVPLLDDDSLLVIPGDWMELFTNGAIPAIRHRVLDHSDDREALVLFQNVAPMRVGPLESFIQPGTKPHYPSVKSDIPYIDGDLGVPRWQAYVDAHVGLPAGI
jgi:isopenicillin N synthase-like dioxygenase